MKNLFKVICVFLLVVSCTSNSEEVSKQDLQLKGNLAALVGEWQLVEQKESVGGEVPNWEPVSNGYVLKLKSDMTFESDGTLRCATGSWDATPSKLVLNFTCGDLQDKVEFGIETLSSSEIVLNNTRCIELCIYKFKLR